MALPAIESYPLPEPGDLPAPRVAWELDPDRAVLLLHDLQEHFLDAYGERSQLREHLLEVVREIRDVCDRARVPVVYTAQPAQQDPADRALLNDFWGEGLVRRPHRAAVTPSLEPRAGDTVLTKWRYSAFQRSPLADVFAGSGRDQLLVTGIYASIGVQVTACEAFMRDVQPFVVADAVADFDRERHDGALRWVSDTCGVVLDSTAVLRALTAGRTGVAHTAAGTRS